MMNDVLKKLIDHIELPADRLHEQDLEIREVFIEEVEEIIDFLESAFPHWLKDPSHKTLITDIRRSFHTLKGSGRMAGALQSGELAWSIESLLNQVIAGEIEINVAIQKLVAAVVTLYRHLIIDFKLDRAHHIDLRPWIVTAQQLREQHDIDAALEFTLHPQNTIDPVFDSETDLVQSTSEQLEIQTLNIYFEEVNEHLQQIFQFLHLQTNPEMDDFNELLRAIHTIRGSSGMVGVDSVFTASSHVENVFKILDQTHYADLAAENLLLLNYYEYVKSYIDAMSTDQNDTELATLNHEFEEIWRAYSENSDTAVEAEHTQGLVNDLLELEIDGLLDAEFAFAEQVEQHYRVYLEQLLTQCDALITQTHSSKIASLNKLIQFFQRTYLTLLEQPSAIHDMDLLQQIQRLHQYLIDVFDGLASGQNIAITPLVEEEFEHTIAQIQNIQVSDDLESIVQSESEEISRPQDSNTVSALFEDTEIVLPHQKQNDAIQLDADLLNIFLEESDEIIVAMDQDFNLWQHDTHNKEILNQLLRHLHTLKGGANMVQATHLGLVAHELETIYERLSKDQLVAHTQLLQDVGYAQDAIALHLQKLKDTGIDTPQTDLVNRLHTLAAGNTSIHESSIVHTAYPSAQANKDSYTVADAKSQDFAKTDYDPELLAVFLEEFEDLNALIEADYLRWESNPQQTDLLNPILRHLHTLKGSANLSQAKNLGAAVHALETVYQCVLDQNLVSIDPEIHQIIRITQDDFAWRLQQLKLHGIDPENPELLEKLAHAVKLVTAQQYTEREEKVKPAVTAAITSAATSTVPPLLTKAIHTGDEVQVAIVESYLDEAQELFEEIDSLFVQWQNDRKDRTALLSLQRAYHTLKGSARIVAEENIARIAYLLEEAFEKFAIYQIVVTQYDELLCAGRQWLEHAIFHSEFSGEKQLIEQFARIQYQQAVISTVTDHVISPYSINEQAAIFVQGDGSTPPTMYAENKKQQTVQAHEQIRISADLVEKMIDLSGESAINRSRIELDLGQMTFTLSEMELAIQRLADQLRRMEGELETQIIAKHETEGQRYTDFDLLEMDQYSSLNQLSKSLAESASDLIDFKTTLADKIRDTENLLLQQSRIQNELQQNLMGTRLVPFTRLTPRLQRLVRQTAADLNRPVELVIENTEGELDRNILERLVSPLEHMLRNAIDHGIEDQDERKQLGKPLTGSIKLNIARESNDILVTFSDDGRGINVDAVKQKAIQNGLLASDTQASPLDIMQYIFHSGLTTAQKLTQISGRGVGLDVVQSEIKALGGHVSVVSAQGKGAAFTIRVPTTVAVSDALMVRVGDQQFALPLANIERIVRVSPVALSEYYASRAEEFELDQSSYRLRYVGEFITGQAKPVLSNMGSSIPVIIVSSGGRSVALQVDQLVGSRAQIVIKPIGKQLSSVGYIGGATILADGHVSLILDGQSLARRILTSNRPQATDSTLQHHAENHAARRTVLVVDDSVTVRKVTSRLLERQGYDVVTAKDGLEALEKLAKAVPDVMLLDIEMPRMDGFEVLKHVRTDAALQHLPIIMITSRTGEKHREHAYQLGVNAYMGKPFQEHELLEHIGRILNTVHVTE